MPRGGAFYGGRLAAAGRISGVFSRLGARALRTGACARFFVEFITGILLFYKKPAKPIFYQPDNVIPPPLRIRAAKQ